LAEDGKGSWKRDHAAVEKNERQISSIVGHKYERGTRKEEKQGNSVCITSRGARGGTCEYSSVVTGTKRGNTAVLRRGLILYDIL
jgi:hypothetical protein